MLRVRDWTSTYENNRTRELKKLDWVPIPNKQDGDGYTELLDHPDGDRHFAAWIAIVQVASKCDIRGTLSRDGARPHDARSLSRITRISAEIFDAAIPRLLDIGWLENVGEDPETNQYVTSKPQEGAVIPQESAGASHEGALKGREWKGMEGNTNTHQSPSDCTPFALNPSEEKPEKGPTTRDRDKWFDEQFWPTVWAKIGVAEARKVFHRKARTIEEARLIVKASRAQRETILQRAAATTNGTPIHPATWLNQERYRDEHVPQQQRNGTNGAGTSSGNSRGAKSNAILDELARQA